MEYASRNDLQRECKILNFVFTFLPMENSQLAVRLLKR